MEPRHVTAIDQRPPAVQVAEVRLALRAAAQSLEVASGQHVVDESRVYTADGHEPWALRSLSPVFSRNGDVRNIVVASHDITGLRQAERQARRLATIVEGSSELIAVTDGHGMVTYLNQGGQALLGLAPDADLPAKTERFLSPAGLETWRNPCIPGLETTGRWRGRLEFRHFGSGVAVPRLASRPLRRRSDAPPARRPTGGGVSLGRSRPADRAAVRTGVRRCPPEARPPPRYRLPRSR